MSRTRNKRKSSLKVTTARERMEKLDTAGSASYLKLPNDTRFFEPVKGKNLIDILGYEVGSGNPVADEGTLYYERTFYIHRGIGVNQDRVICSARTFGRKCAACEEQQRLRREGDGDQQSEKLAIDLAPKQRQVFNVLDTKHPDKGIMVWEISSHLFGKNLDEEIDGADEEDAWELFHTYGENGKTLRVNMVEDSFGQNTFLRAGSINFTDRRKELDEAEMLEQMVNLDDILVDLPYEKVKAMIDATTGDDDDDDDAPKRKRKSKKKAPVDDDDDDDLDYGDDDDDDDDNPPPKKRKKRPPVDDDDDDDDDDGDDEEQAELEAAAARKKKRKAAAAKKEVEVDDDDDDDCVACGGSGKNSKGRTCRPCNGTGEAVADDDDDDDAPPPKKKPAKKPAKKAPVDDDDDDDDWNDFDDDDDAAPAKKKPVKKAPKKKAPVDDDDDDDWDDDDDDDDAPAPKKKPAKKTRRG